jgi:tRNA-dihydrouridine synthase
MMAEAARYNIDRGAQIIDINMGCPAKKVCNKWAGSALMQDEAWPADRRGGGAACAPHGVPVTLKMRTGWCQSAKNAPVLARAAESAGVQMLTVHGRTREQGYKGLAEHDTVAAIKASVRIPVVANGDIDSPEKAREVLAATGCDAVMIGRAAQGRPWIFREIAHFSWPPARHCRRPITSAEARMAAAPPARPLHPVRRIHRRAQRAQAPGLVRPFAAGRPGGAPRCFAKRINRAKPATGAAGLRACEPWATKPPPRTLETGRMSTPNLHDCVRASIEAISATSTAPIPPACTTCWSRPWKSRCSKW